MPKKQTRSLDEIVWEGRAMYFARALVAVMDGMEDHDIQGHTGLSMEDCDSLAKARADALALIQETQDA